MSAEFDLEDQGPAYKVELVNPDGTRSTAWIDATTGDVRMMVATDDEGDDDNG